MSTAVAEPQQPIEVVLNTSVDKSSPVKITLPDTHDISNVDFFLSNGHLTTVVSPSQAFQVINQDYLAPVIAKPNAIVRPLRRDDPMNDSKLIAYVESQIVKGNNRPLDDFTKELDTKLRGLKNGNKSKSSSKNGSNQENLSKRPLFITTVPKGIFLQPPQELPVPSKRVYAYSSKPRIFTNRHGHSKDKLHLFKIEKSILNAVADVRGLAHHYHRMNRESPPNEPFKNLMHDKRIIRGSNFGQSQTIAPWNPYFAYAGLLSGKTDPECNKDAEIRRRNILRKKVTRNQRNVIGTPPPVCGRKHEDVQTDKYLEELFDKPPEIEIGCQTDLFLYRPPSPPFVPSKIGVDKATEILDGDLFVFDIEVQPILETLVGHSIQQGLVEVLHEEEIAETQIKQQEYLAIREAELAEMRRLAAEEIRLQTEKDRRILQDSLARQLDTKMQENVTAARLLQGHIANLVPAVLNQLEPLKEAENREELERKLCPWLTQQVAEEVGHMIDSREILTAIVKEILVQRAQMYNPDFVPSELESAPRYEEEGAISSDSALTNENDDEHEEDNDAEQRSGSKLQKQSPVEEDDNKPENAEN